MPELPEVETVRLQLVRRLKGKTISSVEVFHPKTVAYDTTIKRKLRGKVFADIDRIGKLLIFSFKAEGDLFLLGHLKMTGQFFYRDKHGDLSGGGHSMTQGDYHELPGRHTRLAIHFTDDTSLFFNDMRLFGYVKIANAAEVAMARAGFGPELIAFDFDMTWFADAVRKRKAPIKAVLLDQSFVSGLGNIYVDEALWRAKVRPMRRADTLTKKEALAIADASAKIMQESISMGGTTFQHFKDTNGDKGNFSKQLKVFGKHGTPCSRCGTAIKKVRAAGRGTHYCPKCQR